MVALGPSGAFGRYGPLEVGPTEAAAVAVVGVGGVAALAAGDVEGYGAQGPGPGVPGGLVNGPPRIRVATLGASCCATLPHSVTQSHNIGEFSRQQSLASDFDEIQHFCPQNAFSAFGKSLH